MDTPYSIDELLLFHEVLRAGSLTKASERRNLAKSTVSRRLAHLEKQVGALLLKRNTRRVVPTEVGQALYVRCERILDEIANLDDIVTSSRDTVSGTLRVSIPNEFGSGWLGKALSAFALKHTDLHLDIEVASKPVNLIEEPFDVAINFGKLNDSRLVSRRLALLSRGIYASSEYAVLNPIPTTLEQLNQHPFIVTDLQQREGTLSLRSPHSRRRITVQHRIRVNSMRLARELVLGGVGLAVLPRAMCEFYVGTGQLVNILPSWRCPSVEATAVVQARNGIPRKTRVFLDFVAEYLINMESSKRVVN